MKKLKLITILVALTVLLFTSVGQVAASTAFKDVSNNHWATKEIDKMYKKGLIAGYSDGKFLPSKSITRGEAAALISRALDLDTKNVKDPNLKDVNKNYFAYNDVAAVHSAGIMVGYNNRFHPNKTLTRAEMAAILVKGFQLEAKGTANFKDVSDNNWAKEAIEIVASNGLAAGYEDNTFRPNDEINRAEFAVFLSRVLGDKESELKKLLREVYKNELEIKSYEMTSDMKLEIRLSDELAGIDEEFAMIADALKNIEMKMEGSYQLNPMIMELDVTLALTNLNMSFDMPIRITEDKMLMKLPEIPGVPLPDEIAGKFIEFDLATLEELSGGTMTTIPSNMALEMEFAKVIYDIVIDHFTDGFYEFVDLDAISYSNSIDAKNVVKFELTNADLKRFLIIFVEDFLPEFLEALDDPKFIEYLGMTEEEFEYMKMDLELLQETLLESIADIEDVLNINELKVYSVISQDNYIEHNTMNIDVDFEAEGITFGFGIYSTDERKNINGTPTFKYGNINPNDIISFEELMMLE